MEQFHNNSMIIYFADRYILVSSKSWSHYNSVVIEEFWSKTGRIFQEICGHLIPWRISSSSELFDN